MSRIENKLLKLNCFFTMNILNILFEFSLLNLILCYSLNSVAEYFAILKIQ